MIRIEIEAATADELHAELEALVNGWSPTVILAPPTATPPVPLEPTDISVPAKKRGATKKATPPASDVTDINPTTGEAVSSAPAVSPPSTEPAPALDDVRNALKRLAKAKGENAVWDLLGKLDKDGRIKSATTAVQFGQGQALIDEVAKLVPAT